MAVISGDGELRPILADRDRPSAADELELARLRRGDDAADRQLVAMEKGAVEIEVDPRAQRADRARSPLVDRHAHDDPVLDGAEPQDVAIADAVDSGAVGHDTGDVAGEKQLSLEVGGADRSAVDQLAEQR